MIGLTSNESIQINSHYEYYYNTEIEIYFNYQNNCFDNTHVILETFPLNKYFLTLKKTNHNLFA